MLKTARIAAETIDTIDVHRYNNQDTGEERESNPHDIAEESETLGESFANERRMNGTREPRGQKADCQKPRRISGVNGT